MKPSAKIQYNRKMKELKKMLSEIENGLLSHELDSKAKGLHYGHVGDLEHFADNLGDVRDCLLKEGEYAD